LTLLASAANLVFAAPAPVSEINNSTATSTTSSSPSASESDIQRLERLLQNRNRVQLQMQQQIDEMSLEISELRGQLERNSYDMQQMLERQRQLFIELDRVRNEVKTSGKAVVSVDNAAESGDSTGTFSTDVDEQTAYQNAVDMILKQRDYTGAIAAFQQFQKDFPDSTFTPNSHYWLGQLYFAKKQDKEAVKSFAAVVAYSDSNKRADALVKLGDISARNNNQEQAKKYYQQVVAEYPNSASAKVAKTHL
ncbi:MAG: tol-pal system protein YbgF, partial [Vibrio gallaecicus]